ncbi:MAG: hypothetical protein ABSE77_04525 [Acidimicrobiales bacterium]
MAVKLDEGLAYADVFALRRDRVLAQALTGGLLDLRPGLEERPGTGRPSRLGGALVSGLPSGRATGSTGLAPALSRLAGRPA